MVVSGRILFGERVRDALLRHLEKDLGRSPCPVSRPTRRPSRSSSTSLIPPRSGFHDPRHHAVSLAYVVPVDGDCQPTQEALDLAWFPPARSGPARSVSRRDDQWPRPPASASPLPTSANCRRPGRRVCAPTVDGPRAGARTLHPPPAGHGSYPGSSMPDRDLRHAAAALRSALVDRRWCVSKRLGWSVSCPVRAGLIESVEAHGQHLEIQVGRRGRARTRTCGCAARGTSIGRRQLAASASRSAGADRGRRLARRLLQRPRRRDLPSPRRHRHPGLGGSVPTSPALTPISRRLRRVAEGLRRSRGHGAPRCCSTNECSAGSATSFVARFCGWAS